MSRVRVSSPAPQAQKSSCQSGGNYTTEKIIGSLVGVNGHTSDIVYDLFFTTERVIAAIIQHPADATQSTSVWQYMFLGTGWSAGREKLKRARTIEGKRRGLQAMTPDELASANSRNFDIRYSEIASVDIRRRLFQSQLRFYLSSPSTTGQIIRFNLSKKQVPEARRLLKLASLSEAD